MQHRQHTSATAEGLIQLFGLNATPATRRHTSPRVCFHSKGLSKGYAILTIVNDFAKEILKLNEMIYKNRELIIEVARQQHSNTQDNNQKCVQGGRGTKAATHTPELKPRNNRI